VRPPRQHLKSKKPQFLQDQAQVPAGTTQDGVDCIPFRALEPVAVQLAVGLQVADDPAIRANFNSQLGLNDGGGIADAWRC